MISVPYVQLRAFPVFLRRQRDERAQGRENPRRERIGASLGPGLVQEAQYPLQIRVAQGGHGSPKDMTFAV